MTDPQSAADSRRIGQDLFEVRLARELVQRGLVSAAQLDEAMRQQVILGGHLATNLWELRVVDGKKLTELSAEILGVSVADPKAVNETSPEVRRVFSRAFVEQSRILPVAITGSVLQVATCEPWDLLGLGRAAFHAGYPVEPYFLAEVPLLALLEKLYDVPTSARFWLGVEANERRSRGDESLEAPPASGPDAPKSLLMSFVTAEVARLKSARARRRLDTRPRIIVQPVAQEEAKEEKEPLTPIADLKDAERALAEAQDRDAMGAVVLRCALAKGRRIVLFVRKDAMWAGWMGAGEGVEPERVRSLSIPTLSETFFGLVAETGSHYLGPMVPHVSYAPLLLALGGTRPRSLAFFPVHMRGRLVFGLYLDGGSDAFVTTDVGDLVVLAQRLPAALERLLAARRKPVDGK